MQANLETKIKLNDGRWLSYAEYGSPDGRAVFYFHGWPGYRLEWPMLDPDNEVARHAIRLIAVDRPGYGISDHKPKRTLLDWPGDLAQLADALGLPVFSVIGYSGGTPFALATAYKLAARLKQVVLIATAAPFQAPGVLAGVSPAVRMQYALARWLPGLYRLMWQQITPQRFIEGARKALPEVDRRALEIHEVQEGIVGGIEASRRVGMTGAAREGALLSSPWGFELSEIRASVSIWHGALDEELPLAMGKYVAATVPGCRLSVKEGEGHLSLPVKWMGEILERVWEKQQG